jgi:Spy/CpxP family protein refolding chaperone
MAVVALCAPALGSGLAGAAIDRVLVNRAAPAAKSPAAPLIFLPDTSFHPIESILRSPTEADRRAIRAELTRQLQLTPAQADTIDSIMNRRSGEFRALREQMRPRVQHLVDAVHASIEQVLTPEQREQFRRMQPSRDSSTTP